MSNSAIILPMPPLALLDLDGKDSEAILHNLTTNEIKSLKVGGDGVETFVTNVKGKCIGHVLVYRTATGFRLIGAGTNSEADDQPSQSESIAAHADRYTIREDAVPTVMDSNYQGWLLVGVLKNSTDLGYRRLVSDEVELDCYDVPWVRSGNGQPATLVLVPSQADLNAQRLIEIFMSQEWLAEKGQASVIPDDEAEGVFHACRIETGFPWYGIDVDQSHLPQEVGREPQTISFTKGCYLGQETVARLDALGQVQKMLVAWSIDLPADAAVPAVDTKLFAGGEKPVGRLTSVAMIAANDGSRQARALGYARRTHFEPGSTATGQSNGTAGGSSDQDFTATVVASSSTSEV